MLEKILSKLDCYLDNLYICSEMGLHVAWCIWESQEDSELASALFGEGCVYAQCLQVKELAGQVHYYRRGDGVLLTPNQILFSTCLLQQETGGSSDCWTANMYGKLYSIHANVYGNCPSLGDTKQLYALSNNLFQSQRLNSKTLAIQPVKFSPGSLYTTLVSLMSVLITHYRQITQTTYF